MVGDSVYVPDIFPDAFAETGTAEQLVEFYLPWTKAQHIENFTGTRDSGYGTLIDKDIRFGSTNCILHFKNNETILPGEVY